MTVPSLGCPRGKCPHYSVLEDSYLEDIALTRVSESLVSSQQCPKGERHHYCVLNVSPCGVLKDTDLTMMS